MATPLDDRSLDELEEERDFLLRSLQDLERERAAGDIAEADHAALSDAYTARAAAVLRATAAARARRPSELAAAAPPAAAGRRSWRGAMAVGAIVAFAVTAGALVARSSGERLPGDPATGAIAATGPSDDLARARRLIGQGRTLDAIKLYDAVLAKDPRQVEALAYRGWLLRLAGKAAGRPDLVDEALGYLDRAVAADPSYPDAHFFRGLVLYQDKADPAAAVPELRAFLANDPPPGMASMVERVLRQAMVDAGQAPPPPG